MAEATKSTKSVPVTTFRDEEVIILELTKEEAQTLADITAKISGNISTSRRNHTDSIMAALYEVGVEYGYSTCFDLTGNLSFRDS